MEFPEPLFESCVEGRRLCLVCARKPARRALWTVSRPIVPLCEDCRADWNFYGYLILRRIKPGDLILRVIQYKLLHPFQAPSCLAIWRDLRAFQEWAGTMKKFM